jgi:hypothetical protein
MIDRLVDDIVYIWKQVGLPLSGKACSAVSNNTIIQ